MPSKTALATRVGKASLYALILGLAALGFMWATSPASGHKQAGPTLYVKVSDGHGSGVHIGNGYILTAAHVVEDASEVEIIDDLGKSRKAAVYWINKSDDLALLRVPDIVGLQSAGVACRVPKSGELIRLSGNPLSLKFVDTWGRVSGGAQKIGDKWASVFPVDATVVMGMSGGPAYDEAGDVVGITVGVMTIMLGFSPSLTGFGAVVPAKTACDLLGRS